MRKLSNEALKQGELWGHAARDWASIQEPAFRPLSRAALDAAGVTAGMRVLDAGCGSGGGCALALDRGATPFGVDASVNMITIARERLPRVDFHIAELEDLPFSNAEFDAVLAVNSIQTTTDPKIALHELGRVLKPGCRLALVVFGDPERCDTARISGALRALFEKTPASLGPFAMSDERRLRMLVESVLSLHFESMTEAEYAYEYPDVETAVRGMMSAGGTWRAAEILGEDRVRSAVRDELEQMQQPGGGVRVSNHFRILTARRESSVA